ncbi:hypothetical protein F5887DRAFT_1059109 [Amanita rubescens]|nr:hypothetical protein F5887DRAFT_1059109 [Amanita rubescens]
MVRIHTIDISPPLINASCAWSSDLNQLQELYDSPYTGAVTTRTATLDGFQEDESHTVAFTTHTTSTLNSYGYSPHPLSTYLSWIQQIFTSRADVKSQLKPFIVSITTSNPNTLRELMHSIQHLREKLKRDTLIAPKNPQIAFSKDPTLTLGLKLPPYVYREQFHAILETVETRFLPSTNTLGNSLLYPEQVAKDVAHYALPTALGGLGGELIHPLSLGNVHTFRELLRSARYARLHTIQLIGEAAQRMYKAGASVVGCATYFGKEGTRAFQMLS